MERLTLATVAIVLAVGLAAGGCVRGNAARPQPSLSTTRPAAVPAVVRPPLSNDVAWAAAMVASVSDLTVTLDTDATDYLSHYVIAGRIVTAPVRGMWRVAAVPAGAGDLFDDDRAVAAEGFVVCPSQATVPFAVRTLGHSLDMVDRADAILTPAPDADPGNTDPAPIYGRPVLCRGVPIVRKQGARLAVVPGPTVAPAPPRAAPRPPAFSVPRVGAVTVVQDRAGHVTVRVRLATSAAVAGPFYSFGVTLRPTDGLSAGRTTRFLAADRAEADRGWDAVFCGQLPDDTASRVDVIFGPPVGIDREPAMVADGPTAVVNVPVVQRP